jgi:hypothetical protein
MTETVDASFSENVIWVKVVLGLGATCNGVAFEENVLELRSFPRVSLLQSSGIKE